MVMSRRCANIASASNSSRPCPVLQGVVRLWEGRLRSVQGRAQVGSPLMPRALILDRLERTWSVRLNTGSLAGDTVELRYPFGILPVKRAVRVVGEDPAIVGLGLTPPRFRSGRIPDRESGGS